MINLPAYCRALAEIAGIKLDSECDLIADSFESWTPADNIEQAFKILDKITMGSCGNIFIRRNDGPLSADWNVRIDYEHCSGEVSDSELPRAICLAVISALDLKP